MQPMLLDVNSKNNLNFFRTHSEIKCVFIITAPPKAWRIQQTVNAINHASIEINVSLYNPTAFIVHIKLPLNNKYTQHDAWLIKNK